MGARVPENQLIAGRYRLLSPLGEGGMGVVWRARDEALGREVAVKEVRAPAGLALDDERRLYRRLEREAWAAARISHRNVVTVYDVATEDGRPWIVMELVHGLSLADVIEAEGPLPPRRAALIGAEVLAALGAAHEAGVLHRDVKPGNVLLANDGRVVLSDFGIAVVEGASPLTMTGELIGSPEFLAPERALGLTPGPASDLWSLGVLLYAAIDGGTPFRRNTPLNTLRAVTDDEPAQSPRAGELAPVIAGLLHKDPAERLSPREAARQLRLVAAGGAVRADSTPVPAPYTPTVITTPPVPFPVPGAAPTPSATDGPPDPAGRPEPKRATVVLAVGVAAFLLAAVGLAWALIDNAGRDDRRGGGGSGTSAPPASSDGPGTEGTAPGAGADGGGSGDTGTDGGAADGGAADGGTGSSAPARAQTVEVHAVAVRDSYAGRCPPPGTEAPAFRATITVGRTPATVEYRWTAEDGGASAWQRLRFPAGDGRRQTVDHSEGTDGREGARRDRIRVEIRIPVAARSAWVPFSITCDRETPAWRGSSSPSAQGTFG
ncbi:serine/threonine-protein kinase [Streptomyces sp. NPDC020965]|uniref:serine/threonine-protein kinase n=1 Tax=Streptomyces sp. NPDC020965 TaxID=3365105 RepID=UPI0037AB8973